MSPIGQMTLNERDVLVQFTYERMQRIERIQKRFQDAVQRSDYQHRTRVLKARISRLEDARRQVRDVHAFLYSREGQAVVAPQYRPRSLR